jgi:sugar phosphate isomerase/epimerase
MPSLPRSLSLAGLAAAGPWGTSPRERFAYVSKTGYRAVQLDATAPTLRPRELDRSARRDIAAQLRRLRLRFSGLDLFIPPLHFADAAHVDRAITAAIAAGELAVDLARFTNEQATSAEAVASASGAAGVAGASVVTLDLGSAPLAGAVEALRAAQERTGAIFADCRWPPQRENISIDPAGVIMRGGEAPHTQVLALRGHNIVSARLNDFSSVGRVPPGEGSLDLLAYEVCLTTLHYGGPLVVDVRGMEQAQQERVVGEGMGT